MMVLLLQDTHDYFNITLSSSTILFCGSFVVLVVPIFNVKVFNVPIFKVPMFNIHASILLTGSSFHPPRYSSSASSPFPSRSGNGFAHPFWFFCCKRLMDCFFSFHQGFYYCKMFMDCFFLSNLRRLYCI